MIKFVYSSIEHHFVLQPGDVVDLAIENPNLFKGLFESLLKEDDETFSLTEDGKSLDFARTCVVLPNLFELNPNSKKILTGIYKKIDRTCLSESRKQKFDEINDKVSEFISDIAQDFDGAVIFNSELAIPQILGLLDFKFDFDDSTFMTSLISYLKAYRETTNLKLVFVNNLFSLLDPNLVSDFCEELSYLGLSLINITNHLSAIKNKWVQNVIIDKDLCEIY